MNSFYSPEELKSLGLKEYGENVLISRKCSIYGAENIRLGSHVRIDDFCVLSGKVELGNYVHIAASCLLYGGSAGITFAVGMGREMESKKNSLSGDLRLSVMYHRNTCIHCIDRFSKDYPGVNFSIYNNWADPGPFDLCIGGPDRLSQYDSSISLLREEIRLVAPFGHRLANNSKVAIDDIKNEKFIISSTSNQMFQIFQAVAKDAGFIPNVSIVSNDLYCIRQYFDLGMGIALIPRFSWVTLFKDAGVIIPFESPIYRTVHMFWNMHNLSKPSLALFKQYMEDEFRKIGEGQP